MKIFENLIEFGSDTQSAGSGCHGKGQPIVQHGGPAPKKKSGGRGAGKQKRTPFDKDFVKQKESLTLGWAKNPANVVLLRVRFPCTVVTVRIVITSRSIILQNRSLLAPPPVQQPAHIRHHTATVAIAIAIVIPRAATDTNQVFADPPLCIHL